MSYHYTESGLDNVWLENGYTPHETAYGKGVSIEDTEGLHKAIGRWLVSLPKPLNGAELRFIRLELELTQKTLGGLLSSEEQAVRRWEKSRNKAIPGAADRLLRAIYSEYLKEGSSVRRMVDRLAELDQIDVVKVCFRDTTQGWEPHTIAA
jgi:putative transcriptional regulator